MEYTVLGIDLAGVETRPTGICMLRGLKVYLKEVKENREILEEAWRSRADLVAIDAPLSMPKGRASLEERSPHHLRRCDRELLSRKIKFFPVTLGPMRKLTYRGMKLKEALEREGFKVIEVYPGGAQDLLGMPRKGEGKEGLLESLRRLGLDGLKFDASDHELDALTSAIVGALFLKGLHEAYGDLEEGLIIMPKMNLTIAEVASALTSLAKDC